MNSRASFWAGRPGQWIDPIVELSDEFRIIAMDQRNAGRSHGPVRAGDGWDTYVADSLALLDHLAVNEVAVMGGCIGVSYCLRLCADAPGRVRAAVLQNPIGRGSDAHDHFGPMFDAWAKDLMISRSDVTSEALAALRVELFGGDFVFSVSRDFLGRCHVPMLVLPGDDAFHPTATAHEIARLAPNAVLIDRWRPSDIGREASVALVRQFLRLHTDTQGTGSGRVLAGCRQLIRRGQYWVAGGRCRLASKAIVKATPMEAKDIGGQPST